MFSIETPLEKSAKISPFMRYLLRRENSRTKPRNSVGKLVGAHPPIQTTEFRGFVLEFSSPRKYRKKGDVFALFLSGVSIENISSFRLSFCEQDLHFVSLRIKFLKSS